MFSFSGARLTSFLLLWPVSFARIFYPRLLFFFFPSVCQPTCQGRFYKGQRKVKEKTLHQTVWQLLYDNEVCRLLSSSSTEAPLTLRRPSFSFATKSAFKISLSQVLYYHHPHQVSAPPKQPKARSRQLAAGNHLSVRSLIRRLLLYIESRVVRNNVQPQARLSADQPAQLSTSSVWLSDRRFLLSG